MITNPRYFFWHKPFCFWGKEFVVTNPWEKSCLYKVLVYENHSQTVQYIYYTFNTPTTLHSDIYHYIGTPFSLSPRGNRVKYHLPFHDKEWWSVKGHTLVYVELEACLIHFCPDFVFIKGYLSKIRLQNGLKFQCEWQKLHN